MPVEVLESRCNGFFLQGGRVNAETLTKGLNVEGSHTQVV